MYIKELIILSRDSYLDFNTSDENYYFSIVCLYLQYFLVFTF